MEDEGAGMERAVIIGSGTQRESFVFCDVDTPIPETPFTHVGYDNMFIILV